MASRDALGTGCCAGLIYRCFSVLAEWRREAGVWCRVLAMKTSEWSSIASSLAKVALELLSCDWDAEEGRGRPATDEAGDQPPKLPMREPKRPSEREDESDEMVECARAEGEMGATLEYC